MVPEHQMEQAFTFLDTAAVIIEENAATRGISMEEIEILSAKMNAVIESVSTGTARRIRQFPRGDGKSRDVARSS